MRCLLCIARWVSFATSQIPFFCFVPWSVGGSLIKLSLAGLMPMSLCEIGKIEGGHVCKLEGCLPVEIRFCSVISRIVVDTCQCGGRKDSEGC